MSRFNMSHFLWPQLRYSIVNTSDFPQPKPQLPNTSDFPQPRLPNTSDFPQPQLPNTSDFPQPKPQLPNTSDFPQPQLPNTSDFPHPQLCYNIPNHFPQPQLHSMSHFPQPEIRYTIPNTSDFPQPLCSTIPIVVYHSKPNATPPIQSPSSTAVISPAKVPPMTAAPLAPGNSTVDYYSEPNATPPIQSPSPTAVISPAKVPPMTAAPPAPGSSTVDYYSEPNATLPIQNPAPTAEIARAKVPPMTAAPPAPGSSTVVYYSEPNPTLPIQTPAPTAVIAPAKVPPLPHPKATPPTPASSSQLTNQPYKNRLQQALQISNSLLPVYQTVNEGFPHAPKFRSTVCVNGVTIESQKTFWTRKESEEFVAKLGYKHLKNITEEVLEEYAPLPQEEKVIWKCILHGFAVNMRYKAPSYNTRHYARELSMFESVIVFNEVLYNGSPGKNKKEAEHLAAKAVVKSLLDDPTSAEVLREVIDAQRKIFGISLNADNSNNDLPKVADNVVSAAEPIHGIRLEKSDSPLRATVLSGPASSSSQQQAATESPIEFVPPSSSPLSVSAEANPLPPKKRRRKNRNKSNKRLCLGGAEQAVNNTIALSQAPTSSVPLSM